MTRTILAAFALSFLALFVVACQQDAQMGQQTETQKHMQITTMMQDSSMMNAMLDSISSDGNMRTMMMQKMMYHVKADSGDMMEMCKMMMDDKEMHAMMMKMMGDGTMPNGGMLKNGKMQ